jgi:predicted amidohydrolase
MYTQAFSLFVVYANRVGFEDGVGFWGGSAIVDPSGCPLGKGRYYEPDLVVATMNLDRVRQRRVVAPMLRDEALDLTIHELLRIRNGPSDEPPEREPQ